MSPPHATSSDDLKPYLFKTNDYGQTWTMITGGIPNDEFTRVIREDPNRRGLLYAGTETGIYVSFDDGMNWQRLESNLPVTPVYDFVVKGTDLVVATHGRAFWILDDLSPLHQMQEQIAGKSAHLFKPRDTTRVRHYGRAYGDKTSDRVNYMMAGPVTVALRARETPMGTQEFDFLDAGKNPPNGVVIHYYLKSKPDGDVTLRILDASGNEINAFSSEGDDTPRVPVAAGANRFVWDYRGAGPTKIKQDMPKNQRGQMAEAGLGPRANPGEYKVELKVGDETMTESFTILRDPRLDATDEALAEQFQMKSGIRDKVSQLHDIVNQINAINKQLDGWTERIEAAGGDESLKSDAKAVKEKLEAVLDGLIQVKPDSPQPGGSRLKDKLTTLSAMIDESDDAPTQGADEVFADLGGRVDAEQEKVRQIVSSDLAAFNKKVSDSGIAAVVA